MLFLQRSSELHGTASAMTVDFARDGFSRVNATSSRFLSVLLLLSTCLHPTNVLFGQSANSTPPTVCPPLSACSLQPPLSRPSPSPLCSSPSTAPLGSPAHPPAGLLSSVFSRERQAKQYSLEPLSLATLKFIVENTVSPSFVYRMQVAVGWSVVFNLNPSLSLTICQCTLKSCSHVWEQAFTSGPCSSLELGFTQ